MAQLAEQFNVQESSVKRAIYRVIKPESSSLHTVGGVRITSPAKPTSTLQRRAAPR